MTAPNPPNGDRPMTNKTITFECPIILAEPLAEMASKAVEVRDSYEDTSATHWLAWDALAKSIAEAAKARAELLREPEGKRPSDLATAGESLEITSIPAGQVEVYTEEDPDDEDAYMVHDTGNDWDEARNLTASEAADAMSDRRDHYEERGAKVKLSGPSQILSWVS